MMELICYIVLWLTTMSLWLHFHLRVNLGSTWIHSGIYFMCFPWFILSTKSSANLYFMEGLIRDHGDMSDACIRRAFQATEDEFTDYVRHSKPELLTVGACCLVGVIRGRTLHVANLGDSRAVLGSVSRNSGKITATQLTMDHNASSEEIQQELRSKFPEDDQIVMMKHGVWRVKGIIQVSRSIGDIYLKSPDVNMETLQGPFRLAEPVKRPVLSSEPTVDTWSLQQQDRFLIFASDGLWEHLSNQDACEIVHRHARSGVARKLIKAALCEAARKREVRYEDLRTLEKKVRRFFHDDITVVVVFVDHELFNRQGSFRELSLRGGINC
ncbi:hypothetical protein KP509_01G019800 [Ceratopteris richardii]|uniref:PPM-type phosphatase domain-containing protein n=1 Tax=Ceratopteris richardii TaxID=49495 RepID=A0A8T2VHV6_CERRI|nr:hypothetical protein KP509_01G019800 [Ceratopteris richardii]